MDWIVETLNTPMRDLDVLQWLALMAFMSALIWGGMMLKRK